MRTRRAGPLLGAALLLLLISCGRGGSSSPAAEHPDSDAPRSFALALGIDADDPAAVAPLAGYDVVVVDGEGTSARSVTRLQNGGATVLAYLSAGTVEPGRPWFETARDEGWLLDHWDDWDEWYADVSEPGLRDLVVDQARSELAKGFDGLFLDNTDMIQGHPDQRDGMRQLVAALDETAGEDRLLFAQNGDPTEAGIVDHLDGWNREDVSFTYDFDQEKYVAVSAADHRDALRQLQRLGDAGLTVTATDYLGTADTDRVDQAADAACGAGALSFVSDIGLTKIPGPPRRCPGT